MAPSSASRLSFYHQEQKKEEEEVDTPADVNQKAPSSVSNLSLLTGIALSLASPVSDEKKDDDHDHDTNDDNDDDDDAYGIFLSFSEDDNDEHHYNESAASPSLKYNDYAFHKTTTAPFGVTTTTAARGLRQQWME